MALKASLEESPARALSLPAGLREGLSLLLQCWYKKFSALAGSKRFTKGGSSAQGSGRS